MMSICEYRTGIIKLKKKPMHSYSLFNWQLLCGYFQ